MRLEREKYFLNTATKRKLVENRIQKTKTSKNVKYAINLNQND